jgi:hypothetical protein
MKSFKKLAFLYILLHKNMIVTVGARAPRKGTIVAPVCFDDDDDVFDEEAEAAHVSRLVDSTVDVVTGSHVSVQFEEDVTMGLFLLCYFVVLFIASLLLLI